MPQFPVALPRRCAGRLTDEADENVRVLGRGDGDAAGRDGNAPMTRQRRDGDATVRRLERATLASPTRRLIRLRTRVRVIIGTNHENSNLYPKNVRVGVDQQEMAVLDPIAAIRLFARVAAMLIQSVLSRLRPLNKQSYSRRMIASGLLAMTGVYAFPLDAFVAHVWLTISAVSAVYFYILALKVRACGHGLIIQRYIFFFPWPVDPCPKCGRTSFPSTAN